MYVNNAQINKVLELHLHKVYSTQGISAASSTGKPDELILSSRMTEMQDVKQAISALPDMRTDLISGLRSKIESGTYNSGSQDIADCMMRSTIKNLG
ncbi:MAG: flagellar biosynthesis anti-sigma factor FlgM [Armatimonadota bacterium]